MNLSDHPISSKNLDQGHIKGDMAWPMLIERVAKILLHGYVYYALEHSKYIVHKIIFFPLISHKAQVVVFARMHLLVCEYPHQCQQKKSSG